VPDPQLAVKNKFSERQYHNGGEIWVLTIDHPPLNLLTRSVFEELESQIGEFEKDALSKVLIISGKGTRAFSGGVAIEEIMSIDNGEEGVRLGRKAHSFFNKIESLDKPVIAAINALCMGGGNELALACHFRIASETAKFSQPEISLGFIPGFGATQRLPRLVGLSTARKMMMTGESIGASEALRIGLVDVVVGQEEVLKAAITLAKKLADKSQLVIRMIQIATREGLSRPLNEALEIELECFKKTCESEDMKEGLRAFKEKRKPNFKNR